MSAALDLRERWQAAWPEALAAWGPYTRLHAPVLHVEPQGRPSFAWFSTVDVEVHIDLAEVERLGIADHPAQTLAHEVGHHVHAPGDLTQSARIVARVAVGLAERPQHIGLVANLWSDMLINDRLQRRAGLDMVGLWAALPRPAGPVMQLVMRANEILWGTGRGVLTAPDLDVPEGPAMLCARLVRGYTDDPVGGAAGFSVLVEPLLEDGEPEGAAGVVCHQNEPAGSVPGGIATDPSLGLPALHPALDPLVVGQGAPRPGGDASNDRADLTERDLLGAGDADSGGNTLAPAAHHVVLATLGLSGSAAESARAWYRENAARHLVDFPVRTPPQVTEQLLGAHETWELGDDLSDVDWSGSLGRSPVVVPGVTTVRRTWDEQPGEDAADVPVDLDLYLDSSGSMPDPTRRRAPVALAGAVLALSALRAGARVQATTWSGAQQIAGTGGFTRDADRVLDAIVAHFGGGTSFPLPLLARTHLGDPDAGAPPTRTGPCHIAVISDDGVTSMADDVLSPGWGRRELVAPVGSSVAARSLAAADAGGSLVLELDPARANSIAAVLPGYDVYPVQTDADLVRFSRDFARRLWGTR